LAKLYASQDTFGVFVATYYWSSSEYNATYAWYQDFSSGNQNFNYKDFNNRVRPVRAF